MNSKFKFKHKFEFSFFWNSEFRNFDEIPFFYPLTSAPLNCQSSTTFLHAKQVRDKFVFSLDRPIGFRWIHWCNLSATDTPREIHLLYFSFSYIRPYIFGTNHNSRQPLDTSRALKLLTALLTVSCMYACVCVYTFVEVSRMKMI